jgi:hypothetical protein
MISITDGSLGAQKIINSLNFRYARLSDLATAELDQPIDIDTGTSCDLAPLQCAFIEQLVRRFQQILSCHGLTVVTCYKKIKQSVTMETRHNLGLWRNSLIHGYMRRTTRSARTFWHS